MGYLPAFLQRHKGSRAAYRERAACALPSWPAGLGMRGAASEGCSLNTLWLPARTAGLTLLMLLL